MKFFENVCIYFPNTLSLAVLCAYYTKYRTPTQAAFSCPTLNLTVYVQHTLMFLDYLKRNVTGVHILSK